MRENSCLALTLQETLDDVELEDFTLLETIGKGCFGQIFLARKEETGEKFAMKVLSQDGEVQKRHAQAEQRILRRCSYDNDCPFIISLHSFFQADKKLHLVLEYIPGGDLYFHLSQWKHFPEPLAKFFLAEVLCAIEYLHSIFVAYRDLKPENIILDDACHVKLVDFGLAKEGVRSPLRGARSFCGTPEYLAPEILRRKGYGTAVDVWGMGMVLYEFLTGLPPWYSNNGREELFKNLRRAELVIPKCASESAASILKALLEKNPAKRIGTVSGMQEVRAHPFFEDMDWEKLKRGEIAPPINPLLPEPRKVHEEKQTRQAQMPVAPTLGDPRELGSSSLEHTARGGLARSSAV
jgi:serine/threonine protein kinase